MGDIDILKSVDHYTRDVTPGMIGAIQTHVLRKSPPDADSTPVRQQQ